MTTAVMETPAIPARQIRHDMDRGILINMGADLKEEALLEEYFEYRNSFGGRPGPLDGGVLHMLVVHQNRRKAKAASKTAKEK